MKLKRLIISGIVLVSFEGCAPVPSYSVDSYVGSLDQCLDIEGTYEKGLSLSSFLPSKFGSAIGYAERNKFFSYREQSDKGDSYTLKKTWLTISSLDKQHLKAILFNIEGQTVEVVIGMYEKRDLPRGGEEDFSCDKTSWQKSYAQTSHGEGGSRKWRTYSKVEKLSDKALKKETKNNSWGGFFGLYHPGKIDIDNASHHRKVDLTVDDIRAMNDKAKRAIAQYDQLATSPPPK